MFERFTDRARHVIVVCQQESRTLNHNYIGTEHILLGLVGDEESVAGKALQSLGISLDGVRRQVEEIIGQGQQAPSGHIPFTPRAKHVLELSLREALQLGHNYIGTEHILLGLVREGDGVGAKVLVKLGAELTRVRQAVIELLTGYRREEFRSKTTPPDEEFLQNLRDAGVPITVKDVAFTVPQSSIEFESVTIQRLQEPTKFYEVYAVEGEHIEGTTWVAVAKPKGERAGVADNPTQALINLIKAENDGG